MQTPNEWVTQAEQLLLEGRLDEAVDAYSQALTQDPEHIEALLGAGSLCLTLELPVEARKFIDRLQALAPEEPRVQVVHGLWQEGTGDSKAALATFANAAKQSPENYAARYHHGRALVVAKKVKESITELRKAVGLGPENIEAHYALGTAYKLDNDLGASIKQFSHLLELDPGNLDGYVTLVDVMADAQQFDMALEVLKQAKTIAPDVDIIDEKRAAILVQKGEVLSAVETLQELAKRQDDPKETLFNIAAFSMIGGKLEWVADATNQLLERYPKEWRTQHLYAQLLDAADKPEEAVNALKKAHQLAPQVWQPLNDLGDLLNAKVQSQPSVATQAVDVLTEACRLAPVEQLAPRYNLILAYWNAGHHQRAKEAAQLLVSSNDPKHPIVQQTQEVLQAINEAMAAGQV